MTPAGLAQLKNEEGLRLTAYPDPLSGGAPWTIGYGHTGPEVHQGLKWTKAQAEAALAADVAKAETGVEKALPWTSGLDPVRRDVLPESHTHHFSSLTPRPRANLSRRRPPPRSDHIPVAPSPYRRV